MLPLIVVDLRSVWLCFSAQCVVGGIFLTTFWLCVDVHVWKQFQGSMEGEGRESTFWVVSPNPTQSFSPRNFQNLQSELERGKL